MVAFGRLEGAKNFPNRLSAKAKAEVVLCHFRAESLEDLIREIRAPVHKFETWHRRFPEAAIPEL